MAFSETSVRMFSENAKLSIFLVCSATAAFHLSRASAGLDDCRQCSTINRFTIQSKTTTLAWSSKSPAIVSIPRVQNVAQTQLLELRVKDSVRPASAGGPLRSCWLGDTYDGSTSACS